MTDTDTEPMVYSVYIDAAPNDAHAPTISEALRTAGFTVHSVRRLDTTGVLDYLNTLAESAEDDDAAD